ncbi:hypothetical protein VFC49_01065 [Thermococcus sp. SY098]|uniref:hypothetical protein n=1 Tax=Thermococcus sp. SY098 TaxID=3111325 RepID=UPI002D78305E|nr:hypothetical protein [Thermococcus sp. SY098]WRS52787.1 hypothetical protein VFC49_01065 [Thermococcus sp. SY098]
MDEVKIYEIRKDNIRAMLKKIAEYNLADIEVENRASFLDDMLKSTEDRLRYALQKLEENDADTAKFIIKSNVGMLIVKIEDVITIRVTIKDYKKFVDDFRLAKDQTGGVDGTNKAGSRSKNILG